MSVQFINGETYESSYGITGRGDFTPLYMIANGNKYFVRNTIKQTASDSCSWAQYENNKNVVETEAVKEQLVSNGGKYLTFHSIKKDPLEFLDWVKEQGYSLQIFGELFGTSERHDGVEQHTDFSGNLVEYSAAFHFRIYDVAILTELRSRVTCLPQYYHYKREKKERGNNENNDRT